MLRPDTFALTAVLALLTAAGPLSVDMYLPSLPDIGRELAARPAQVQLTISFYLVGFALGQIVYGPISDRHGRKPILLAALALFSIAGLACAFASSIEVLIIARFLQAFGGSGAVVLARAIVRDLYSDARAGREFSLMGAIMAVAPTIAPLIGSVLQAAFSWHAIFVTLFALGSVAAVVVGGLLPETLKSRAPEPLSLHSTMRIYRTFMKNSAFLAHLGIVTSSFMTSTASRRRSSVWRLRSAPPDTCSAPCWRPGLSPTSGSTAPSDLAGSRLRWAVWPWSRR
jgi:MFS transporter, DHA1 family, multidrug resistance protein